MLVDNFVKNPLFDINLLKDEFKNLAINFNNIDFEFSSNFAKASLERAKKVKVAQLPLLVCSLLMIPTLMF